MRRHYKTNAHADFLSVHEEAPAALALVQACVDQY